MGPEVFLPLLHPIWITAACVVRVHVHSHVCCSTRVWELVLSTHFHLGFRDSTQDITLAGKPHLNTCSMTIDENSDSRVTAEPMCVPEVWHTSGATLWCGCHWAGPGCQADDCWHTAGNSQIVCGIQGEASSSFSLLMSDYCFKMNIENRNKQKQTLACQKWYFKQNEPWCLKDKTLLRGGVGCWELAEDA